MRPGGIFKKVSIPSPPAGLRKPNYETLLKLTIVDAG
jgi:hypothetical protein